MTARINRPATRSDLFATPGAFLGLGFGSGLASVAPGTFGTLAAVPIYWLLVSMGRSYYLVATLIIIVSGVWICGHTAKILKSHDHPAIVWDEFAGYLVTMLLVPATVINVVAGFFLFRLFDIAKPWPIRWVDRNVHGGFGIVLDDLIAGVVSAGILLVLNEAEIFSL